MCCFCFLFVFCYFVIVKCFRSSNIFYHQTNISEIQKLGAVTGKGVLRHFLLFVLQLMELFDVWTFLNLSSFFVLWHFWLILRHAHGFCLPSANCFRIYSLCTDFLCCLDPIIVRTGLLGKKRHWLEWIEEATVYYFFFLLANRPLHSKSQVMYGLKSLLVKYIINILTISIWTQCSPAVGSFNKHLHCNMVLVNLHFCHLIIDL